MLSTLCILLAFFIVSVCEAKQPDSLRLPEFISFSAKNKNYSRSEQPRVLLFSTVSHVGSVETSNWILHKRLIHLGFSHRIALCKDTDFQSKLIAQKIDHYALKNINAEPLAKRDLITQLRVVCKNDAIDIVQTHNLHDACCALKATQNLKIQVVLHFHQDYNPNMHRVAGISGAIAVSHHVLEFMKTENTTHKLGIKYFEHILVLPNKKKFTGYRSPFLSRKDFFRTHYNIDITDAPVMCMIAQFYKPEEHIPGGFRKNHALLIRAAAQLIHEHGKPVHVLFVGDGPSRAWHENLCYELHVEKYVHFLGYCSNTNDILHYSDFHILTSIGESCGSVHLEAAYMKKPSIGPTQTGAEYVIADGQTGLLFKNNDLEDVLCKIKLLIDNPDMRTHMGHNAFDFATGKKTFSKTNLTFLEIQYAQAFIDFYNNIMKKNGLRKRS